MTNTAVKLGLIIFLGALTGCAGSLSHIETQKRMRATYAGFPPVFANAELNAFRARYLSEKAIFDQDRNAFMGLDGTAQSCPISSTEAERFARTSFRLPIGERSPGWSDYMNRHGIGYAGEVMDKVQVRVLQGDCSGGTLNGPAQVLMSYIYILSEAGAADAFKVHEVTVRENCSYANGRRDGDCIRYTWERNWDGKMLNGRLMHYQHAQAQAFPMYAKKIAPGEEHYTYTTIFDYGQYRHGVEAAPGVAFETTPYERNRVSALENHTLARTALPDGRVAYDEFYGDNHRVRYILRDGIAHGELVYSPGESSGDARICFQNGVASLSSPCTS